MPPWKHENTVQCKLFSLNDNYFSVQYCPSFIEQCLALLLPQVATIEGSGGEVGSSNSHSHLCEVDHWFVRLAEVLGLGEMGVVGDGKECLGEGKECG